MLIVSVVQKSKEIGILRAMGASRGQILRVFLLQGAVLGLVGSLHRLGARRRSRIVLWSALVKQPRRHAALPARRSTRSCSLAAALLATLTGLVAAYLPALRGARLDPVVAIRG